jgi:alpha-glucosidase
MRSEATITAVKPLIALIFISLFLFDGCVLSAPEASGLSLNSPDNRISVIFFLDNENNLNYKVYFKNQHLIKQSLLDIVLNGVSIGKNCEILDTSIKKVDEVYDVPVGKLRKVRDICREGKITVRAGDILYDIIFRVYDNGVAFRYNFPKQAGLKDIKITEERSHFNFPQDYRVYAMELNTGITPTGYMAYSYEGHYNETNLSGIDEDALIGMPLLVEGDHFYAAITEAALKDYGGASLKRDHEAEHSLVTNIAKARDNDTIRVKSYPPFATPWRVIMIGEKLADLVESNIILNLNDETAIKDTSWIVPGKAVWPWWTDYANPADATHVTKMNTQVFKQYIDFASKHNVPYLIIDAGWYCPEDVAWSDPLNQDATKVTAGDLNLGKVINYGKDKNVKIILWVHGATLFKQLDEALKTYDKWGVAGIKVDDWGREDQEWVNFWWEVAEKAASYKLIVDFHGTYKPTGLRKVYPNVLTREAVAGLEQSKWGNKCNLEHEVTIPFTRMLAGPMDFTPGAVAREWFGDKFQVEGTVAHQLAMYVVYESPLQMLVDYPAAYENNKEALSFLETVPTTWDETRLIGGQVGDYVVMARRSGEDWFIGVMTDKKPRQLKVTLDFLGDGEYTCDIYTDLSTASNDPTIIERNIVEHKTVSVKKGNIIRISLVSGGGFAARLQRLD